MKEVVVLPSTKIKDIDDIFDLDNFERGHLLKKYIKRKMLTINSLSKKLGVDRTIVSDWLRWNKILEREYEVMVLKGFNNDKIKTITKFKYDSKDVIEDYFLIQVEGMVETINKLKKETIIRQDVLDEAIRVRNEINYLLFKIDNKKTKNNHNIYI